MCQAAERRDRKDVLCVVCYVKEKGSGQWPVYRGAAGIPDSGFAKRTANREKADRLVSASSPAFLFMANAWNCQEYARLFRSFGGFRFFFGAKKAARHKNPPPPFFVKIPPRAKRDGILAAS